MDRLQAMQVFVQVADSGGFARAAEALELPRATVTSAVQQLERRLGVRLLTRTTRRVALTEDGRACYRRCVQLLADFDEVEQLFASPDAPPRGTLRVELPARLARRIVVPALPGFFERFPDIHLQLSVGDKRVDPLREGLDVVIRVGGPADERCVQRRLGALAQVNIAAPAYLERYGEPADLAALAGHYVIGYRAAPEEEAQEWLYVDADGRERSLPMQSRLSVDNADAYRAACIAGLGLAQVPVYDTAAQIAAGRLRTLLPAFRPAPLAVCALYPQQRHGARALRAFIEWMAELFAGDPLLCGATTF